MPHPSILQSSIWQEFQESIGRKTYWVGDTLLVKHPLPMGYFYLFAPEGPFELTQEELDRLTAFGKKIGALFIRIEPRSVTADIRKSPRLQPGLTIHPQETNILDLSPSSDDILKSFKQKTRYNIGLAHKKGVIVETTTNPENSKVFFSILQQTTERDKIKGHPKQHYKKMLEVLGRHKAIKLYLARYENTYIAAQIVTYYKGVATYLHGASSNEHRNVMAPYSLQWHAIVDAKEAGCHTYDFFGITSSDDPRHPWQGITRFKLGFSQEIVRYPGCFDITLKPALYSLYKIIKRIRS